jgi:IS66 Orf2 like protein
MNSGLLIPPGPVRVLVATRPVDFRKGMNGLAALVQEQLKTDPFSGTIYFFRSKRAKLSTFCIPFPFCDDCLPLAPVVRAKAAGITVSSRQGIDMHLHRRAA